MVNTLINVLKERTHSSIIVMVFFGFHLSPSSKTSRTVGQGMPRRAGSSSFRSMYSPFQINSASFAGMGGVTGPAPTAFFKVWGSGRRDVMGDSREKCCSGTMFQCSLLVRSPARESGLGKSLRPY